MVSRFPNRLMSIEDAIAYHSEAIDEYALKSYTEFGEPVPSLSTTLPDGRA